MTTCTPQAIAYAMCQVCRSIVSPQYATYSEPARHGTYSAHKRSGRSPTAYSIWKPSSSRLSSSSSLTQRVSGRYPPWNGGTCVSFLFLPTVQRSHLTVDPICHSQVFRYRKPLTTVQGPPVEDDDSEDDFARLMASRRRPRQAEDTENLPAAASSSGPPA